MGAKETPQLLGVRIQVAFADEHRGDVSWPQPGYPRKSQERTVYIELATAEQYGIVPPAKKSEVPVENPETIEDLLQRILDELDVARRSDIQ